MITFTDNHEDEIRKKLHENNNNNACQKEYLVLTVSIQNSK